MSKSKKWWKRLQPSNFSSATGGSVLSSHEGSSNLKPGKGKSPINSHHRDAKNSVRLVATSNISLSGFPEIDGVQVVDCDEILVVGQTDKSKNGIYIAQSGDWRRRKDANKSKLVTMGLRTWVTKGDTYAKSLWVLTNEDPVRIEVTDLVFEQIPLGTGGSTDYVDGVTLVGTDLTFSGTGNAFTGTVDLSSLNGTGDNWGTQVVVSDTSLTGDGTVGNPLSVASAPFSGYQEIITPGTIGSPITVTHSLGRQYVMVQCIDVDNNCLIEADEVNNYQTNSVDIVFQTNPTGDVIILVA